MKNMISSMVTSITSFLRRFRLERTVIAVLAGILLLTTTACNPPSPEVSGTGSYNQKVGQQKDIQQDIYGTNQRQKGGMNTYSDTDPRRNVKGADAKARALVDQANRNTNRVNDPEDFAESYRSGRPLDQRVRNVTERVGDAFNGLTDDVSEGTQRGVRNLQENVKDAGRDARGVAQDVRQNTREAGKSVQRAAEDAKDYAQDRANDTANAVRDRA
jgi:predicted small secreted protein